MTERISEMELIEMERKARDQRARSTLAADVLRLIEEVRHMTRLCEELIEQKGQTW